jgi:two-component system CheB/CheR fusion protein
MFWLTTFAISAAVVTLAIGALLAAKISNPLSAIASIAQSLGKQEALVPPPPSYKEVNIVTDALMGAAAELAKLRERERLLVGESSHRVKNILAVVQSLVQQTLRGEGVTDEARTNLLERLQALARAQDVLTSQHGERAFIDEIISAEFSAYGDRMRAAGPQVRVGPKFAQTFSLILHELATNASKYGALSNDNGRVSIAWSTTGQGGEERFQFQWRERDGPPVRAPVRKGFGTTLLESTLAVDGAAPPKLSFDAGGLSYVFEVPLSMVRD